MSIIARNPETGEAAWAYQMTPFDEWDYDGVNEMILVDDMDVKGKKHNVLVHFDRNGLGYTVDPQAASRSSPRSTTRPSTGRLASISTPRARPMAVRRSSPRSPPS